MPDSSGILKLLQPLGLFVLGQVGASAQDMSLFGDECGEGRQILLVGNAGSSLWPAFTRSPENGDGQPHPMDRWSRRIGTAVAVELGARVVFPFDGPPYAPVLNWAMRSGQAFPSPISMYIHGAFGLWHAYRFALLLPAQASGIASLDVAENPCLSCSRRPCLSACPVGAFTGDEYLVDNCVNYLAADEHSDCRQQGCKARTACPFAPGLQYRPRHARFHMEAFLASQYLPEK